MAKLFQTLFILLVLLLCLNCNSKSENANLKNIPQFSGEKSKLSLEVFEKIDYQVKESGEGAASDWHRQEFHTLWNRFYEIKRRTSVKEQEYTYPRYTVVEEVYETKDLAAQRLKRIKEKPPNLSGIEQEYWIVTGFQNQKNIYFIQTDSVLFSHYMDEFAAKLAAEIKR